MRVLSFRCLLLLLGVTNLTQTLYIPSESHSALAFANNNELGSGSSPHFDIVARGRKKQSSVGLARRPAKTKTGKGHVKKAGGKKAGSKKTGAKKSGRKKTGNKKTGGKSVKSHASNSATSTLSGYCPLHTSSKLSKASKASKKPKKHVPRRSKGGKLGDKKIGKTGGKPHNKSYDVCDYKPKPRPSTGNTCDYLISCEFGNEVDSIGPDTDGKSTKPGASKSKSHKGSKVKKPSKPSKSQASRRSERQAFSVNLYNPNEIFARGGPRRYKTEVKESKMLLIYSLPYPSNSDLYTEDVAHLQPVAIGWNSEKDLGDFAVKDLKKVPKDMSNYVTEHLIELQTIKMFIQEQVKSSAIEGKWFEEWWNKKLDSTKVQNRKSKAQEYNSRTELPPQKTINDLVFQALGSTENRADFVLCNNEINTYKMRMWLEYRFMAQPKFARMLREFKRGGERSDKVIGVLQKVFGVYSYMNHKEVEPRLNNIFQNVKRELSNIEELTGEDVNLDILWTAFMTNKLQEIGKHGKKWLEDSLKATKKAYEEAIKDIEMEEKKHLEKKVKEMLRSTITALQKDIESLDAEVIKINKDIETTKAARKELQAANSKATESKDQAAIDKTEKELEVNEEELAALKKDRRENEWERNAKAREVELQFYDDPRGGPGGEPYGVMAIKKELKDGLKTLLEFEKKSKDLKLPVLGSQIAIPIRPGGS